MKAPILLVFLLVLYTAFDGAQSEVVDCLQSEWGPWDTNCTQSCNGGLKYRRRSIMQEPWSSTFNYTNGVCSCDVVLMLDTSFSIPSSEWDSMVVFVKSIVSQLAGNKLGIVTFDSSVITAMELSDDKAALFAAIDDIQRCDGYTRVDCYERHTYDALPVAQQLFEQEMASNPYRSACRVVLTVTHGSPIPENAATTAANVNALTSPHPDWGLLLVAVGPNAWLQSLQSFATSPLYITEATSYSDLPALASGILSQCVFPKSPLKASNCKCDYIIGLDSTFGPKFQVGPSSLTYRDLFVQYVLLFVRNLIDLTASSEDPNRIAFLAFGSDLTIMTTNTSQFPANSSDRYFFPNLNDTASRNAMYMMTSAGQINRTAQATSALGKIPVCSSGLNQTCYQRKSFDGLAFLTQIMEMEPEASRTNCKMLILFMNHNHSMQHLSIGNEGIVEYIMGRHPEWSILIITVNATKTNKQNYLNLTNSPANIISFTNYTLLRDTGAKAVVQLCSEPDQPNIQYPIPCGPSEDHELCNTTPCGDQNCQYSGWIEDTPCNASCGGGYKWFIREILAEATGNGLACAYNNIAKQELCNPQPCSTCSVVLGSSCPEGYLPKIDANFSTPCLGQEACLSACCDDTCATILNGSCPVNFLPNTNDFSSVRCTDEFSCTASCCDATCASTLLNGCPSGTHMARTDIDFSQTTCSGTDACVSICCNTTCAGVLESGCPASYLSKLSVDPTLTPCFDTADCTSVCCDATCANVFPSGNCPVGFLNNLNVDFAQTACADTVSCTQLCCNATCTSIFAGGVCPQSYVAKPNVVFAETSCADTATCTNLCCESTCALAGGCPANTHIPRTDIDFNTAPCEGDACVSICCQPTCFGLLGSTCPPNLIPKPSVDFTTVGCNDVSSCQALCCEATCASILGSTCPTNYTAKSSLDFSVTPCQDTASCTTACCDATCASVLPNGGVCPPTFVPKNGVDFSVTACANQGDCTNLCCSATCAGILGGSCPTTFIAKPSIDFGAVVCTDTQSCTNVCCDGTCTGFLSGGVCPLGYVPKTDVPFDSTACSTEAICVQQCCTEKTCGDYICTQGALKSSQLTTVCGTQCDDVTCCDLTVPTNCAGSFVETEACTQSCGTGVLTSTFVISVPATDGGKECDYANGTTQSTECNIQPCEVTNCVGSFLEIKPCDKTCGSGVVTSVFLVTTPPSEGGTECLFPNGTTQSSACNTDPCQAPVLTCLSVSPSFCGADSKRVNDPASVNCTTTPCSAAQCCERYHTPAKKTCSTTEGVSKLNSAQTPNETTVYTAGTTLVVAMILVSEPAPPIKREGGRTSAVVGDYGHGVTSASVALVNPSDISLALGLTLPMEKKFATDVLSITRRNGNHAVVSNVPITFYICAGGMKSLKLNVYRLGVGGKLENLSGLGGSVKLCKDCPPTADCHNWFEVTSPTTSSFIGEEAASYCGDNVVNWAEGEQCDPPDQGCCNKDCHFKPQGAICRHARGECDKADRCSGTSGYCLPNHIHMDGLPCNKQALAEHNEHYFCKAGQCLKSSWCGNQKLERGEGCEPPDTTCCDAHCKVRPLPECLTKDHRSKDTSSSSSSSDHHH